MKIQFTIIHFLTVCAASLSLHAQAAQPQVKACEYLDEITLSKAIGRKVDKASGLGDTQSFDGFVLHTCSWSVQGGPFSQVILVLREAPTRALNDEGIKQMKNPTPRNGLRSQIVPSLGDIAQYNYWETESRAGISVLRGTRAVEISINEAGKFDLTHKQMFVSLAQKVLSKF
jgi:hypothetical protein